VGDDGPRGPLERGIDTGYGTSAGMPAGFVIGDKKPTQESDPDCTTFYHAGDTGLMSEMVDVIAPYLEPDAAALPTGDHTTMGPAGAGIAADWVGADVVFPMHYDTFQPIEIDTRVRQRGEGGRRRGRARRPRGRRETYVLENEFGSDGD